MHVELLVQWFSMEGFLLLCIGVVAAMFGVMFGAAGFVLVPAMLLMGVPIHTTVAANKFATGLSSLTTVISLVLKRKLRVKPMLLLMILSMFGGVSGGFLATRLSEQSMNLVACMALIFAFVFVLKGNKNIVTISKNDKQLPKLGVSPFFIGIYDGGFGPGSGSMYITYFLKSNYSYVKAAELTRFLMFASCGGAFLFYYFFGLMNWAIAIPITVGSIIGSYFGIKIIPYIKARWIKIILPIIFLVLIAQVIFKFFT